MAASRKKKVLLGCGLFFILLLGTGYWFYGPLLRYGWGYWSRTHDIDRKQYEGGSIDKLRAMRTALLGYEESEGQFPYGEGWMTAIENRLQTNDLQKGEGLKKLIYPAYVGQVGKYGYGFNNEASAKYLGDIKDPKAVLVYESEGTEKNLHGDPAKMRRAGGMAIAVDGTILK